MAGARRVSWWRAIAFIALSCAVPRLALAQPTEPSPEAPSQPQPPAEGEAKPEVRDEAPSDEPSPGPTEPPSGLPEGATEGPGEGREEGSEGASSPGAQTPSGADSEHAQQEHAPHAKGQEGTSAPPAVIAEIERVEAKREQREGQFIGDTQDATSAAQAEDLLRDPNGQELGTLSQVALYDPTWQITPQVWIRPEGLLQLRYSMNHRTAPDVGHPTTLGFTIARARFMLWAGVTEYIRLRLRVGVNSGGSLSLEQAFADIALGPVTLRVGRFYLPIYGGGMPAPNLLSGLEYSHASNYLDGGQTHGLSAAMGEGRVRGHLYVNDGIRTGFAEFGKEVGADYGVSARFDARLFTEDDWNRFDEFSSFRGSDFAARLGVAGHAQRGGSTGETANLDYYIATADMQLEGDGWHLMAAGGWAQTHARGAGRVNNFAYQVEAGYFLIDPLLAWAGYDGLIPDRHPPPGTDSEYTTLHAISGGLSYFIVPRAHRAKLQAQFDYVLGAINSSLIGPSENNGLLSSSAGDQWLARLQLGLAF